MHSKLRSEEAETSTIRRIEGPWTVIFPEEQGGRQVFERLMSWTEADNKLIRYFSGTAVYHNQVKFSEAELREGQFILDLGQVGCMAEVIVNDKNLGILWKTPYQTDITCALKSGENRLEIRVVNTWQNRIIGDLQPDCEKPFTYTSHQFFKADSPLLTSGLIGPVNIRLKPIRKPSNE